jgi:hypothetical protein
MLFKFFLSRRKVNLVRLTSELQLKTVYKIHIHNAHVYTFIKSIKKYKIILTQIKKKGMALLAQL